MTMTTIRFISRAVQPAAAARIGAGLVAAWLVAAWSTPAVAQNVCLPSPRLLTVTPMGGQAGTQVEVSITGEELEEADELAFSDPRITAVRKLDSAGQVERNKYVVTIAPDVPEGVYEARVMSRLGMSSSRVFCVSTVPEVRQKSGNHSLDKAMELAVDSVCNATMTERAVDHYTFQGRKGQRVIVQCATRGIDSRAIAVLVVADSQGRDLMVERRGGALDFTVPEDGRYVVKVHELTYQGGAEFFYRLSLRELPEGAPIPALPTTRPVNAFSWPPVGLSAQAATAEVEDSDAPQKITLPADIAGRFYPAADVDVYEFEAKKGEVWWIEVGSERLGLPTDPSIIVQHVTKNGDQEQVTDVAEFSDIPSPVKVSSNGYAYDGPPYNAGTSDALGKLEIKQDGVYRLRITDLFGGTRSDARNEYRLVIRKAAPDFAIVAWPLHMGLRNGDRNALSKPIALRGGATMALEVVAIRRDGFDGPIELVMENLPAGVRAQGLTIPAGQSRGIMLLTAEVDAPRGITNAEFVGRAEINGETVTRQGYMATMAWPVRDAWSQIPHPRLMADVPVSVGGSEAAPITVAPAQAEAFEAVAGSKLTIPLVHNRRSDFSGAAITMKIFGDGFSQAPSVKVPLNADTSEVVFDLAALKIKPGDYTIALYGGAVAKYRHRMDKLQVAEENHRKAQEQLKEVAEQLKQLDAQAKTATAEKQAAAEDIREQLTAKHQKAEAELKAAAEKLKQATATAAPKDIAEIVVSEPIKIRIKPAETK